MNYSYHVNIKGSSFISLYSIFNMIVEEYTRVNKSNSVYLVVSSMLLLLPILQYVMKTPKNNYENVLASLLLINVFFSSLFWMDPVPWTAIHFFDGVFGKVSSIAFTIYVLFLKQLEVEMKVLFLFCLFFSAVAFYYSNKFSREVWCSKNHIACHLLFHLLIGAGCIFAFF